MSLRLVPREDWTAQDALDSATLALDPRCNGGMTLPGLTPQELAPVLAVTPGPAWLVRDGARVMAVKADPYTPAQAHLHFTNSGFSATEVRQVLGAFMVRHPTAQWVAIGIRHALYRLICHPLGFALAATTRDCFLATKEG